MNTHIASTNWWGIIVYVSGSDFQALVDGIKTADDLNIPDDYAWLKRVIGYAATVAEIVAKFVNGQGLYLHVTWLGVIVWAWPG